ncbi:hypothetical protein [Fodinibius salinus]|nr:hypothetical protein [Fodinibius salinus]
MYSLYQRNKIEQTNEKLRVKKTNLANNLKNIRLNIQERTFLQFMSEDHRIDLSIPLTTPSMDDTTDLFNLVRKR